MNNEVKVPACITVIVIALGAWGKGDSYESALSKCIDVGGRQNASNMHICLLYTSPSPRD